MKTWSELRTLLQDTTGLERIYFQPPENLKLVYPCIIFERNDAMRIHADNIPYRITKRYSVTLMTKSSDNDEYLDKLLQLPMCSFEREFKTDGIVHELFNIYF